LVSREMNQQLSRRVRQAMELENKFELSTDKAVGPLQLSVI